jgi:hypothetical protein
MIAKIAENGPKKQDSPAAMAAFFVSEVEKA